MLNSNGVVIEEEKIQEIFKIVSGKKSSKLSLEQFISFIQSDIGNKSKYVLLIIEFRKFAKRMRNDT